MKFLLLLSLLMFSSCSQDCGSFCVDSPDTELVVGEKVTLWATMYYKKVLESSETGIPLRNMKDEVIGPKLSESDWCLAAIEGTVKVDGVTYNYAGKKDPRQASCKLTPSSRVRWVVSKYEHGMGNKGNALKPFYSIACDQSVYPFGTQFYIKQADGVELPDGTKHSGFFTCDDVGGAVKENHIDVFIGAVERGLSKALEVNPFSFIKSSPSNTFEAIKIE